ncbi:MAG: HAD family hydrolase [Ruminococcus sp.]
MKKLAVFDLDGTLVNSIYDLADCVNTALRENGLEQNSLEEYYYFVGNGIEHLIRTAMKGNDIDQTLYCKVRSAFDREYALHSNDKTKAYEGIDELLNKLSEAGVMTAILSNKADIFISAIADKNFPHHSFSAKRGHREGVPHKPNPEGLVQLTYELGVQKDECVLIGDSDVDILTAKNAGIDSIGVLWGFRKKEELLSSGAKLLAETPDELFELITKMD